MTPSITFRPLQAADLPMLRAWLLRPHVAAWWGEAESLEVLARDYLPAVPAADATRAWIALCEGREIGFIQCYVVKGSGEGWWPDEQDPGARGIDQFLANEADLGRGLGSAMVRRFVQGLFKDPAVTGVQTDPQPNNARAIAAYRKAGFEPVGEVDTPDGPALLMRCRPPAGPPAGLQGAPAPVPGR